MKDFKITQAEERQGHLDTLTELGEIVTITAHHYLKNPTRELEEAVRSLKETYEVYKKNNL